MGRKLWCNWSKLHNAANWLPAGRITDWPDLQNRFIYWDDKAHLDRMEVLRDVLRQAAFYKVNGVLLKLNAHFQYSSAPAVVEPYALTPGRTAATDRLRSALPRSTHSLHRRPGPHRLDFEAPRI